MIHDTIRIAATLYDEYNKFHKSYPDEMTMHKLMYFLQKENLILHNKFLFTEDFYGWDYGPVLLKSVREIHYPLKNSKTSKLKNKKCLDYKGLYKDIQLYTDDAKEMVANIVKRYKNYTAWELSHISHSENAWKKSQKKEVMDSKGVVIEKIDMVLDSLAEKKLRRDIEVFKCFQ